MAGTFTGKGRILQPPAVLWHGTRRSFEAFDPVYLGASVRNPTTGIGFWFSDSAEDAASWAKRPVQVHRPWHMPPGEMALLEVALAPRDYLEIGPPRFRFWVKLDEVNRMEFDLRDPRPEAA